MQEKLYPIEGSGSVHADMKVRDPSFVMTGHHCHTHYELFYVESGECRFLIDDNIYDLHAGDFILVPPMALHYTRYLVGTCRRVCIFFKREDVPEDIQEKMPSPEHFFNETRIFQVPVAYRDQINGSMRQLVSEEKIHDEFADLIRRSCLQGLLLVCARVCLFLSDPPAEIHTTDQQIVEAARYISEHYMEFISTQDVAKAVGFSPNYLSRKFRTVTGIGLHEYLVFVRLHHAAQELMGTSDSITTIALRCGFSDSNYFKDSFKKKYGVTPRNYRKMA
ncbi:MAG: helix-turn-helix domain-containing protein [Clostridia bacterium]|nr:helix-turn-helix domain-containing protein [Clostridia bacterium]